MFTKTKKLIALALVCAFAMCNLISCDLFAAKECNHEYGEWEITKEPTCTQKGEQTKECEECGDTKTKSVSKLDHEFDENGVCENCGVNENEVELPSGGTNIPVGPGNSPNERPTETPTEDNGGGNIEYSHIYLDSPVNVSAANSHTYTYFRFVPNQSGTYVFYSYGNEYNGENIDVYAQILDSSMNLVISDDDGGSNLNFSISYYLEAGEVYYLASACYSSCDTYYTVCVELNNGNNGGNTGIDDISYTNIYVDDSLPVNIEYAYEVQGFKFTPSSSGPYTFYGYSSEYADSYGTLKDAYGNVLSNDDSSGSNGHFCITECLTAGETYYFEASLWGSDTGLYFLCLDGFTVMYENWTMDVYADAISQYFKFVPEISGTYVFYSYDNEYDGLYVDVYGVLFDDDMNRITSDDDGSDNRNFYIRYYLEAGQTYYFGTGTYSSYDMYYTVKLEAGASHETADIIYAGDTLSANIDYPDDKQWFKFVPTDTGLYTFYGHGSDYLDSYGYLTDSYGNVIFEADDGGENGHFSISYYLTAGETYYWVARMWSSNLGSYEVTLLGFDYIYENESVSVLSDGKETYFKFVPSESGNYILYAFNNEHNGTYIDNYVYIYDSNGYYIADGDSGGSNGNFEINYYLQEGQEYYICVGEFLESSEMAYYSVCVEYDRVSDIEYSNIYADNYYCGASAEVSNTYTYFQFVPEYSGTYVFYSADNYCDSYSVDVYATLFDSKLHELCSNDNGGEDFNFRLSYYLEAGETYYFGAASHTSEDIYFSVALYIDELGYDGELFVSSPVYVSIDEEYDFDLLRFVPEVSGEYLFYSQCDNYIDTYATLLDADANSLEYSDDGYGSGQFGIRYYLEAGQVYYLQARGYSSRTGEFYVICELIG